jgi:energy-coupling factor transporter ATP-binding protein EcfA2
VNPALRFRQLLVRRVPAFPRGGPHLEDLSPGINLVHGPNASGKTTAAQALQSLLWPRTAPEWGSLEGRFELGGDDWRVDVESRRAAWQREGQASPPPPLPPSDDRDRYLLSLHVLLGADDRDLAERIGVESAGGYDVPAAADALEYRSRGRPGKLVEALSVAEGTLRDARSREAELRDELARLGRLREARGAAERVVARLEPLRLARSAAAARERVAGAARMVAAFPAALARLRGDELERLDEWARAGEELERKVARADVAAAGAAAEMGGVGLGPAGVPGSVLEEVERRLDELRRLDDDLIRAGEAMATARGRLRLAETALGLDAGRAPSPDIAAADADRLDRYVRRAESLRERRAALEERIRLLGEVGADEAVAEAATAAARALRAWLRAAAPSGLGGAERRVRSLLLAATLVLGALGLAGVVTAVGAVGSPWVAGLGVGLVLLAALLLALRPGPAADSRAAWEREATRHGHAPSRWTVEAVESLLDELERRGAAARVVAERRAEAERLRSELAGLADEEASLAADAASVAAALGLGRTPEPLTLHLLATRIREREEARAAQASAAERAADAEARRAAVVAAAAAALAPFGYEGGDAAAVAGALKDLRDRRERHRSASAALAAAGAERERAVGERDRLEARRSELFGSLGLGDGDEPVLRSWAEELPGYRTARAELEMAEREHTAAVAALAPHAPVLEGLVVVAAPGQPVALVDAVSAPELELRVGEAEVAVARERELATEITRIEARLTDARQKHDVEASVAAVAEARSDLAERRDRDVEAEVGVVLVEWLGRRAHDGNRPAVFHRARQLFGLITRGRYRLDLEEGDPVGFRAYDNTTHRGHGLDELSSGTRLQLLLAVRLAFVETQESGAALPLLLDEVLANCDDERAGAIIDAALAIARDGRQIFYFTAQPDELAKWRHRLEAQDRVGWCVGRISERPGDEAPDLDWAAARDAVPAPDGMDHAGYGRALRVPPFDLWADGVGGLHLWYLVDDVDALHQLLAMGVTRWGELEYLAATGGAVLLPGGVREVVDRARGAATTCDRFRQLWRQGRGRPVDRTVLEESGAVSDAFMDRVAELCREVDGQAAALLDALARGRVPRFQATKVEELRSFLRARGYLSDGAPLDPERLRVMLLAEAGADRADQLDTLIGRLVQGA